MPFEFLVWCPQSVCGCSYNEVLYLSGCVWLPSTFQCLALLPVTPWWLHTFKCKRVSPISQCPPPPPNPLHSYFCRYCLPSGIAVQRGLRGKCSYLLSMFFFEFFFREACLLSCNAQRELLGVVLSTARCVFSFLVFVLGRGDATAAVQCCCCPWKYLYPSAFDAARTAKPNSNAVFLLLAVLLTAFLASNCSEALRMHAQLNRKTMRRLVIYKPFWGPTVATKKTASPCMSRSDY